MRLSAPATDRHPGMRHEVARRPVVNRPRRDTGTPGALRSRRADGQPVPLPGAIDIRSVPGSDHDRCPLR